MSKIVKKKRVSKKNKLSWRKHVNITDVEEFLEDKRLEERLGPPLETLTNDELFVVDTKPDNEQKLSVKERKRLKFLRPPRCFEALESLTKVPDPISKRNRVRTKDERKNSLIKKKEEINKKLGIIRHRKLQSISDRSIHETKKNSAPKKDDFSKDLWIEDEKLPERNEWYTADTIKNNLVGTGNIKKTVKVPKKIKTSVLPTVEVPHPGMSYNPSYDDHQDLLKSIAEKENAVIKEEKHLNRVTRNMFRKVSEATRDEERLNEMSQGLSEPNNADEASDSEYKAINPPTKNKKKTLKQRRKQKEQKRLEFQRGAAKIQRKKTTDLNSLKSIKKKIIKTDNKLKALNQKRKENLVEKRKAPKRLAAVKFEETDLEFNLGKEITGNLRSMKMEGNLLADRFKSLQRRNVIQPSVLRYKKKAKVKVYTKPGHKENWMETIAKAK